MFAHWTQSQLKKNDIHHVHSGNKSLKGGVWKYLTGLVWHREIFPISQKKRCFSKYWPLHFQPFSSQKWNDFHFALLMFHFAISGWCSFSFYCIRTCFSCKSQCHCFWLNSWKIKIHDFGPNEYFRRTPNHMSFSFPFIVVYKNWNNNKTQTASSSSATPS